MSFKPYSPLADVSRSWRNLPHWHQPDATYFVTFRLADSLPQAALTQLAQLRKDSTGTEHAWIDRWLDAGGGACVLAQSEVGMMVEGVLRHFDGQRYALGDYAIMPNHVHALVQVPPSFCLEKVVHGWKSFSAHELQRMGLIRGRVWQEESFDRIVRSEHKLLEYQAYVRSNPASAGLNRGFILGCGTFRP